MILFLLSLFCILYSIKLNGVRSLVTFGIICATIYALPAMLNITAPQQSIPTGEARYFIEPLPLTVLMYCLYFGFLILNLKLMGPFRNRTNRQLSRNSVTISLYACLAGWFGISALNDGLLFFLQARFDITGSILEMILKWSIPLAIFYGLMTRNKIKYIGFMLLFLQFMTGDRTLLAITLVGIVFLSIDKNQSLLSYFRLRFLFLGVGALCIVIFGKPIYLVIKSGSLEYLLRFVTYDSLIFVISSFEPISIFNHFDFTVRDKITMSPLDFFRSLFGNLLIDPGSIGITVNQTNKYLMDAYPDFITNGIGGSFLANAWMVARVPGLYFFSLTFLCVLRFSDVYSQRNNSFLAVICVLIGALMAVYSHRNGIGNILAFYRQIFILCGVVLVGSFVVQLIPRKS